MNVSHHSGTAIAAAQTVLSQGLLADYSEDFTGSETGCTRARGGTSRCRPRTTAEAVKEETEEEKGRIILVNALAALTSATSRCTHPTRDQIPSKLRERTDESRRVRLHRITRRGDASPMQLKSPLSSTRYYRRDIRRPSSVNCKYFPVST